MGLAVIQAERSRTRSPWVEVATFYGLALLISWIAWSPLVLSRTGIGLLAFALPLPWVVVGTAGPPIAAMIVQWRAHGNVRVAHIRVDGKRAIPATFLAIILMSATFVFGTAVLVSLRVPHGWDLLAFQMYGYHVLQTFVGGPIFEEWGWRGFAQARLQERISPILAALVVGGGWAFWHLPLFLISTWSSASPPMYLLAVIALSVVMAWGFNLSGGWIVTAILLHATYNASSRVLSAFLGTAILRRWPDPVTAITVSFAIVACLITVATRGRLGCGKRPRDPAPSQS